MTPSAKKLEAALVDAAYEIYKADRNDLSVNRVRRQAEKDLGLEERFFSEEQWKQRSKSLITKVVDQILDGWVPESRQEEEEKSDEEDDEVESRNGTKRPSSEPESPPPPKRRKRGPQPKKTVKEEPNLSDLSEAEETPKKRKGAGRRRSKPNVLDENSDEDVKSDAEERKVDKAEESDGDELSSPPSEETEVKKRAKSEEDKKSSVDENDTAKPAVDEEEEYSDVIDEPQKPKRAPKAKSASTKKTSKPTKTEPRKASGPPDDPQTAEIKKLQGQLVKCGVRKLWHNELRQYGDDSRAKIRHLKKMLADIGMDGRFSEARAREIKEARELKAEVEAAREMDALWGTGRGGRASRSKAAKKDKVVDSESSEEEGSDAEVEDKDDDDEDTTFAARRRRAQADLTFLGDDDESD